VIALNADVPCQIPMFPWGSFFSHRSVIVGGNWLPQRQLAPKEIGFKQRQTGTAKKGFFFFFVLIQIRVCRGGENKKETKNPRGR